MRKNGDFAFKIKKIRLFTAHAQWVVLISNLIALFCRNIQTASKPIKSELIINLKKLDVTVQMNEITKNYKKMQIIKLTIHKL